MSALVIVAEYTAPGAEPPPPVYAGHMSEPLHWGAQIGAVGEYAVTVAEPGLTPLICPVCTVATEVLLLVQVLLPVQL